VFAVADTEVIAMELASYPCLSVREAIHYYDVSAKQIKRDIKSGKIPAIRVSTEKGKRWRIFPTGVPEHIQATLDDHILAKAKITELGEQIKQLEAVVEDLQTQLATRQNQLILFEPNTVEVPVEIPSPVLVAEPTLMNRLMDSVNRFLNPLKNKQMQAQG
jgi:hypothetical protein